MTSESYHLPKILAVEISQKADELIILLMYWLYRLLKAGDTLSATQKQRTLGFITALFWFSNAIP